jgi:site-specific recombinase XerD
MAARCFSLGFEIREMTATRKVRLDLFELATAALALRVSGKLARHRVEPLAAGETKSLANKLENYRKRAKRQLIRKFGEAAFATLGKAWRKYVEWVRYHLTQFTLPTRVGFDSKLLWRQQHESLAAMITQAIQERCYSPLSREQLARMSESIGRHGDAVTIYQQRMTEIRVGINLSLKVGKRGIKFSELVVDAIQYSKDHHRDTKNFKQRLELAEEEFGDRVADSISPQELGQWLTDMTDDRSWTAATRNRVKAAVSKAYKLGMDNSKAHTNPARFVPQKKENPGRLRFVSHDEEVLLRNAIMANRPHCIYQFDLALNTGMRKSEQFTVELGQVDFEHEYIYLQMTKNGSERYVHLNRTALNTLGSLKEERDRRGLKFPTLFFDKQNSPIKDPREWFAVTCEEAGIEGVTWHILRHTYCSRLVMAGVDLRTAQELMGHKTLAMTARYAHLSPGHLKTAIQKLDRVIFESDAA